MTACLGYESENLRHKPSARPYDVRWAYISYAEWRLQLGGRAKVQAHLQASTRAAAEWRWVEVSSTHLTMSAEQGPPPVLHMKQYIIYGIT